MLDRFVERDLVPKAVDEAAVADVAGEFDAGLVIEIRGVDSEMLEILEHAEGDGKEEVINPVGDGRPPPVVTKDRARHE